MNCNSNTTPLINEISGVSCNSGCTPKDINVICKTIVIPNGQEILAIQGENNAAVRYFLVPKINENDVDMSDKTFTINIKTNSGSIISKQIEYGRLDSFRLNTNSYRLFFGRIGL